MKTPSNERGQAEGLPLTHRAFLAASKPGGPLPRVQVRKYASDGRPGTLCGQVVELSTGRLDLFKVAWAVGVDWFHGRNVRMCSGDGRCTCEADPATESELVRRGSSGGSTGQNQATPRGNRP